MAHVLSLNLEWAGGKVKLFENFSLWGSKFLAKWFLLIVTNRSSDLWNNPFPHFDSVEPLSEKRIANYCKLHLCSKQFSDNFFHSKKIIDSTCKNLQNKFISLSKSCFQFLNYFGLKFFIPTKRWLHILSNIISKLSFIKNVLLYSLNCLLNQQTIWQTPKKLKIFVYQAKNQITSKRRKQNVKLL
jgi:hypothetical protein